MKVKRVFGLVLSLIMVFSLVACGNSQSSSNEVVIKSSEEESSEVESVEVDSADVESTEEQNSEDSNAEQTEASATEEVSQSPKEASIVYMTTDISPEGLMAVYEALDWTPEARLL